MEFPFVRLTTDGTPPSTRVEIDGVEMKYLTDLVFRASVDSAATCELRMYGQADLEGGMQTFVTIHDIHGKPLYCFGVSSVEDLQA